MQGNRAQEHGNANLELQDRAVLKLTGVCNVDAFDEEKITLQTEQGVLEIQGAALNITQLDLEAGQVQLEGAIDALIYQQEKRKKSSLKHKNAGFVKRLFS